MELRQSQVNGNLQPECVSDFAGWPSIWRKIYFSGVAVVIFVIPLVVFISLYIQVVCVIWTAVANFNDMRVRDEYDKK